MHHRSSLQEAPADGAALTGGSLFPPPPPTLLLMHSSSGTLGLGLLQLLKAGNSVSVEG